MSSVSLSSAGDRVIAPQNSLAPRDFGTVAAAGAPVTRKAV